MGVAEITEVASAVLTALTACAALYALRQARADRQVAIDAYNAQTQPLLTDLAAGIVREQIPWHEVSGEIVQRVVDRAEISVGAAGPEPIAGATVPIRNVGNGAARVTAVTFLLADGTTASGDIRNPVVPSGEFTVVSLWREVDEAGGQLAERVGLEYADFSVLIAYSDASGRPREALRLDISNGQTPYVRARGWAETTAGLQASLPVPRSASAPAKGSDEPDVA
jgi:hypothetical protein